MPGERIPADLRNKLRVKYLLDRIFSPIVILVLSPLFLVIALLIKAEDLFNSSSQGPVFYTEPRISAGKVFQIIKFRTVTMKSVRRIQKNPASQSITGADDTTGIGKLLLNWYLDELPQLVNIARGEMSFVGPRPHIRDHYDQEIREGLVYRRWMKAGLLGIPQACKRNPRYQKLFQKMAASHRSNELLGSIDNLYYHRLKNSSLAGMLFFDLTILLKCLLAIVEGEGKFWRLIRGKG